MKCPRCDQSVAYTMRDASLTMWDMGLSTSYAIIEDGLVVQTTTGYPITLHVCPDHEELSDDELRDEWWVRARSAAYKVTCPEAKCRSSIGQPCMDMRFTRKEPRMQANWPHAARVAVALTPDEYQEGRKNGWIS
jgi:hypothetical protein